MTQDLSKNPVGRDLTPVDYYHTRQNDHISFSVTLQEDPAIACSFSLSLQPVTIGHEELVYSRRVDRCARVTPPRVTCVHRREDLSENTKMNVERVTQELCIMECA